MANDAPTGETAGESLLPKEEALPLHQRLWSKHSALVVSAMTVVLSAWSVFAMAGWDVETAQLIVQEQGTSAVLIGSMFGVIGALTTELLFLMAAIPLLLYVFRRRAWLFGYWYLVLFGAGGLVLMAPWYWAVVALVGLTIATLLGLLLRRWFLRTDMPERWKEESAKRGGFTWREFLSDPDIRNVGRSLFVVGIVLGAVVSLGADPWLPRERLSFENTGPVVGYVLSDSDGEIVYLDGESRTVKRAGKVDLVLRTICLNEAPDDYWHRTLLYTEPDYPDCPVDD